MQGVERQLNLLHLNPVAPAAAPPQPPGVKMGTPHKNSVPAVTQEGEEVRTLFVSGLPMDVRLRELYLLFRGYEGYEGSFLKLISSKPGKPPQPIAFVSFKTRSQAERALEDLQGVRFDPASSQTLRLEFARTNSRVSPRQPPVATSSQGNSSTTHPSLPYQKNTSDTSYHGSFIPVLPTNPPQQLSPHLYAPTDTWPQRIPMQVAYQSLSQLSSPSPTLSPASSFPQLSVLNMLESDNSHCQPQGYDARFPVVCFPFHLYASEIGTLTQIIGTPSCDLGHLTR
jgi:RNA recognition motif-containing protein